MDQVGAEGRGVLRLCSRKFSRSGEFEMTESTNPRAWVFVSHSSKDLARVRRVRNYLERKGASPILFHLRALQDPEDFWPLIKKEIAAPNFFLYCESPAAAASEWVQREREVVEAVRREVRIGHVHVDRPDVDKDGLNSVVDDSRLPFLCTQGSSGGAAILKALNEAGFRVFRESWSQRIDTYLDRDLNVFDRSAFPRPESQPAVQEGWVVAFLSGSASRDLRELEMAGAVPCSFPSRSTNSP